MTLTPEFDFDFLVDWDKDSFAHRNCKITDPVNLFGTPAVDPALMALYVYTHGRQSSASIIEAQSDYGRQYWSWDTGTAARTEFYFGYNPTGITPVYLVEDSDGTFTAVIWIRQTGTGGFDSIPLKLHIYADDGGGPELLKSTAFVVTLAEGWKQVTVTGTYDDAPASIYFSLQKSSTTRASYLVSGPMLVSGDTAPEAFNSGSVSRYDNLSQFARDGDWQIGFNQPYQSLAPMGRARLTLDNATRAFSPENPDSPVAGLLNRAFTIDCNRDDVRERLFTGWIDEINPGSGYTKTCEITASDMRRFAEGRNVYLETQLDVTAWELIVAIAGKLNLPAARNVIAFDRLPQLYDEIFPYALDNLPDGFDALQTMGDITGAVQGHTFFDRDGLLVFSDLRRMATVADATEFDNNFVDSEYKFGAMLINDCTVPAHKRKASVATDKLLWELGDEPEDLEPYETREIRAEYSNPDTDGDKKIAGLNVSLAMTADTGVTSTLEDNFTSANITLENTTSEPKSVTVLEITGQKLTAFNTANMHYADEVSVAEHGILSETLDYSLTNDKRNARSLAEYRVGRFGSPRGEMRSIVLKTKFNQAALGDGMRDITILDPVHVIDDDRFHDQYYIVVGESWAGDMGFHRVSKTLYLEPTYRAFTLDDDELGMLDDGNVLALY